MSLVGQSRPGQASSKFDHVRYAAKSGSIRTYGDGPLRWRCLRHPRGSPHATNETAYLTSVLARAMACTAKPMCSALERFGRSAPGARQQAVVGLRQRLAGIAKPVGDGI